MDKKVQNPVTQEKIFKIMMFLTLGVSAIFCIKNILSKSWQGALIVGGCLLVFATVVFLMKQKNVSQVKQQYIMSMCLVLLVFFISANSGTYYSDDFPLFLAVLALSGLYLEPSYTKSQAILITILLLVLYFLHPEKADPIGQYLMCLGILDLAAFIIYMVIKRGRAFIDMSILRAEEAEKLLKSIETVRGELQENYQNSAERMEGMQAANQNLESNTNELRRDSDEISQRTQAMESTCAEVQEHMQVTQGHIQNLNAEVQKVEEALAESKQDIRKMDIQMQSVRKTVGNTNEIFILLQQQIQEIAQITEQLTGISTSTKMLALNASIEAARAGAAGAGFAVVAGKVQDLAVDSNSCSEQVVQVMNNMTTQIEQTACQLGESVEEINASLEYMAGLEQSFDGLTKQFESLYENIEEQNRNVSNVDVMFGDLRDKISEMSVYSEENQMLVGSIVENMEVYKDYMNMVVEDARELNQLSASMLEMNKRTDD